MDTLRHSLLPRRLTQIYTDTKRSYEHVVRTNQRRSNFQSATTDRKLRIQKDRLVAWGLEWADTSAAQTGDIDGSLDRAGISDLVESIMTSINELLDEAERLQSSAALLLPGSFPDDKPLAWAPMEVNQSGKDLARLDDIVRDLTTSIDTLCDLSRSQQGLRQSFHPTKEVPVRTEASETPKKRIDISHNWGFPPDRKPELLDHNTTSMPANYIPFDLLRIPRQLTAGPLPPSYETVATSSDDRICAFFQDQSSEIPVVLEYTPLLDCSNDSNCVARRFEELATGLRAAPRSVNAYVGAMELLGWFEDPKQSRYGLVYKAPQLSFNDTTLHQARPRITHGRQSENLLSFLQHGANSDSLNVPNLEDRFRLAHNIASSLFHFHARGTTHRNINSNNIMFFFNKAPASGQKDSQPWKEGVIRKPFLASFDQSDVDAYYTEQEPFISSIYRHPHTARGQRSAYKSSYDLYSLGVVLLEIGLWMPISRFWKARYTRADFKVRLQSVYIKKLSSKCGTMYTRVVENCLRAAEESDQRTGQARSRTDLYWDVLTPLERCCVIDDMEERVPDREVDIPEARNVSDRQSNSDHDLAPMGPEEFDTRRNSENLGRPAAPTIRDYTEGSLKPSAEAMGLPEIPDTKTAKKQPCICKVWSHELPAACSAYWNGTMAPKLDRILQKAIDRWESYSIDLVMSGETPEAARPTIYMMCASTDKARKVLQFLNRDKNFFDIKVVKGQITRSKAGKKRKSGRKGKKTASVQQPQKDLCYRRYQQRPACGASIGAYIDNHHLPPVSFGGTVLVNGEPYGMSVHHMLENEDIDMGLDQVWDVNRSMAPSSETYEYDDSSTRSFQPTDLPEALYPFEIEGDDDEGYLSEGDADAWLSEILESEDFDRYQSDDEEVDMGDTDGINPGNGGELIVTQPAIDDVDEGFFPNEEDMDDEHLSSHSLGCIHASSGIKRSRRGAISHEVDWALIKMKTNRMQTSNAIAGGARHCTTKPPAHSADADRDASYPAQVVKTEELGGLQVHALGRTSGLQAGRILPVMSMIKMPGRISSSHSWTVMGNFGGKKSL